MQTWFPTQHSWKKQYSNGIVLTLIEYVPMKLGVFRDCDMLWDRRRKNLSDLSATRMNVGPNSSSSR